MNKLPKHQSGDSPGTPDRWFVLTYVATNYFVLYTHRNLVNYIQPSLMLPMAEGGLGVTEAELAWVGPAWQVPYCLAQLFVGYLSDRYRRRTVILSSLIASVVCLVGMGLVRDVNEFIIGRMLLGLAQACAVPAMASVIADCFRPHTRSKAVAIYLFSYNSALIFAGKFGGTIADLPSQHIPGTPATWVVTGWRMSHFAFAGIGLVVGLVLLVLLKEPNRTERHEGQGLGDTGGTLRETLIGIFRVSSFHIMYIVFAGYGILSRVIQYWLPKHYYNIFHSSLGWGQGDVGGFATIFLQAGTMTGLFCGGILADQLVRRTILGRVWVQIFGWAVITPCLILIGSTQDSLWILRGAMFVLGIGVGAYQANLWTASFDVIDPAARATAVGLFNVTSGILVLTWFDPFVGYLETTAQMAGRSILGDVITWTAAVTVGCVALLAVMIIYTFPRDYIGDRPTDRQ